ncbi:hypothetical protein J500_1500 [Acinetobacter sp. 479375]|nr:hypothetical protein J500_1500 [Acinetobacter sp. 479375]
MSEEMAKPHNAPMLQKSRSFKGRILKFGFKAESQSCCISLTAHLGFDLA